METNLTTSSVDQPRSLLEVLDRLEVDETSSLVVKRAVDGNDVALLGNQRRHIEFSLEFQRKRGGTQLT